MVGLARMRISINSADPKSRIIWLKSNPETKEKFAISRWFSGFPETLRISLPAPTLCVFKVIWARSKVRAIQKCKIAFSSKNFATSNFSTFRGWLNVDFQVGQAWDLSKTHLKVAGLTKSTPYGDPPCAFYILKVQRSRAYATSHQINKKPKIEGLFWIESR